MQTKVLTYKSHLLRRKDNIIYYGSMSASHIVMLQILDQTPYKDISLPIRVAVQLQRTDPDLRTKDKIVKKAEKASLYEALDLGEVWLSRALKPAKT